MYSRRRVGPKMQPCQTPALTGCSYKYFPFWTTQSCLILRKDKIRSNAWPEILCQDLSKALDRLSVIAWVVPDLLKAPAILSDSTIRKSGLNQEDLKPY